MLPVAWRMGNLKSWVTIANHKKQSQTVLQAVTISLTKLRRLHRVRTTVHRESATGTQTMKNVYEVLRQKELELARLEKEVEALRVAAPLLSDDKDAGSETTSAKPTLATSTPAPQQPIRIPQPQVAAQQPTARAAGWDDSAKRWPS